MSFDDPKYWREIETLRAERIQRWTKAYVDAKHILAYLREALDHGDLREVGEQLQALETTAREALDDRLRKA